MRFNKSTSAKSGSARRVTGSLAVLASTALGVALMTSAPAEAKPREQSLGIR